MLWAVSGALFGMTFTAQAAQPGDLIKMAGLSSVYYYASDGKRYVFPNEKTYFTWYADFSSVTTISESELQSIQIGGNVVYRPGTRLVKITTDPKVYAVTPGGMLHHVPDEATAVKLYGPNWNQMIDDVPDAFFTNYSIGNPLGGMHPEGTLIQYDNDTNIYYIDENGNKRLIADMNAFDANRFQQKYVVTGFDQSITYPDGSSITGEESGLTDTAQMNMGGQTGVSAGTITAALASDTPASTTVVPNAAKVPFTKFTVSASSDGDATVDYVKVQRTGLCSNSNFSAVLLLDGNMDPIGNEKTLGSTDQATFNENFTVPAGTTGSFFVAANMASTLTAAENCSFDVVEIGATGSTNVAGTFPIEGNEMTTNNSITIGTASVTAGGSNPSAATKAVGTTNYIVTAIKISNSGSAEDVWVHKVVFTQNGSAELSTDVANVALLVDGAKVADGMVSGKKVTFDLTSNPIEITKGNNKEFTVRVDLVDGSSRTISLDIDKQADIVVKGDKYGFYILPTYPNSNSPYFNANDTTIGDGSVSISKGTLGATTVAEGATQQELAAIKFNVQGEPMVISQSSFNFTVTGTGNAQDISNVTLHDPNGNVVAGPVDPGSSSTSATSTDTFTVPVGISTYTLKGDLNSDFGANDSIAVDINPGTNWTIKGDVTGNTITPSPSAVTLNTVTVKVGKLSVTTLSTPAAQTVIVGTTGFEFAQFYFDATDSGEDIRINQLNIVHKTSANNIQTNIANLQLHDGSTALEPSVSPTAVAGTSATTTITLTNPIVVPRGSTKTLSLKGDIVAGSANQTHSFGITSSGGVTAVGVDTGNTVTATVSASDGQTMTLASAATVTVADDASNPNHALVAAGSTGVTIGVMRITASNGDADLTKIQVQLSGINSGNQNEIDKIYLYDGSTKIAEGSPTSTVVVFNITAGDFRVPAGSTGKALTIKADFANIGTGFTGNSGRGISASVSEDDYEFRDVASGSTIAASSTSGTFSGNQFTIYKSVPIVQQVALSTTSLNNGSGVPIFRFTVGADSKGDIGFYKATFLVTTDTASVTNFQLYEDPDGSRTNLTNNGARGVSETITSSAGANNGSHIVDPLFDTGTDGVGSGGEYVIIQAGTTKTYQLEADISGAVSGSTVSVKMVGDNAFPSTYPVSAGTIDSGAQDNFIWSDLNAGNNSTTATNTAEWTNGYRVFSTTTGVTLSK